jgi:hypothetical protein
MTSERTSQPSLGTETPTADQFTGEAAWDNAPAWEEVSSGRYMPRRIKGSYKGRALG